MLLNILIVAFILFIAYWQGLQGFFSAMLHLGLVIVCGALAFGLWEPITDMLSGMAPRFAAALALILPFVFFLLIARVLMDKFVAVNVDFSQLTNLIAGGLCGALAGALCAGIFVVGCLRLPSGSDFMGYKRYVLIPGTGDFADDKESTRLWIPVDDFAVGLFNTLSTGSFSPANDKPMALYQPALNDRAHWVRTRLDPNTSMAATARSVETKEHLAHELPIETLPKVFKDNLPARVKSKIEAGGSSKLVIIDTQWKNEDKAYDLDPKLRVFPTQVQLVTFADGPDAEPVIHHPFAFSTIADPKTKVREFTMASSDAAVASADGSSNAEIAWMFVLPKTEVERFIIVRNLRFTLKTAQKAPAEDKGKEEFTKKVLALIGPTLVRPKDPKTGQPIVTPPTTTPGPVAAVIKPEDVKLTGDLPRATSVNLATELKVNGKLEIVRGTQGVGPPGGPISRNNLIERIAVASDNMAAFRVRLSKAQAQSMFGQAIQAAGALNSLYVQDNAGEQLMPFGYVWLQMSTQRMEIHVEPENPIRAISLLPYKKIADNDELYVYFLVKRGSRLLSIHIGATAKWDLNQIEVPKKE